MMRLVAVQCRVLFMVFWALAGSAHAKDLPSSSPERQGVSSERLERVSELAERYVDEAKVPGIVNLVLRNGRMIHLEAHGTRGAGDDTPLREDDLFRIYSMTKPVTAVAAMQLYEQGKFHLSDPVTKFVPEFKDLKVLNEEGKLEDLERPMTMHQLLTHTAGLTYHFEAATQEVDRQYVMSDLSASENLDVYVAKLAKIPLRYQPGSRWHYSVAVDVTGLIIERLSGQPLDEYFREHIFAPLKMQDTFFEVPEEKRDRLAANHFINPENGALVDFRFAPPPYNPRPGVAGSDFFDVSLFAGGMGLVSTAMDYARFAEMVRNGGSLDGVRILSPKTVNFMVQDHLASSLGVTGSGENPADAWSESGYGFGLGFGVITNPVAYGVVGSIGEYSWGGAAGTIFWVDPEEELVVVSLIQLMNSPWSLRSDLKVATYQALNETYTDSR